jgi:hypothetical protein
MRFLVHEQPYEKPIAAGQLRYWLDGAPTGAVEHWRLTQATPGYEVLRVDLDARSAASGHSYVYHLVRQTDGPPERLSYRFWGDGLEVVGTLLFAASNVTGTRSVNGRTYPEDRELQPGYGFWFPASVGLGLLVGFAGGTAVTLNSVIGNQLSVFGLQVVEVEVMGERPLTIRWLESKRIIWLDERGWVAKMERDDGLTAVASHAIWY